jgi:hypothetical protein
VDLFILPPRMSCRRRVMQLMMKLYKIREDHELKKNQVDDTMKCAESNFQLLTFKFKVDLNCQVYQNTFI